MSTTLQHLQSAMQRAILSGFDEIAASDAAERLSIYATAYRLRLRDALAHNYPVLQTHLGSESFTHLADRYLDAHPSTHVSVRAFGAQLAEWLGAYRPQEPWLAELARFEWALADAFDAIDEVSLGVEPLARLEPNQWAQLTFRFARSVERLTLRTNAVELYGCSAREEAAVEGCATGAQTQWLIWRQQLSAQYRSMTQLESLAIDALIAGQTFAAACEAMFELRDSDSVPMQAAAFLKRWVSDELIVGVAVAD